MAFTQDLKSTKLRAWAANHPEWGVFVADLEKRWQTLQLGNAEKKSSCAGRKADHQTIATAQSFSLGTGHYADSENVFWANYSPPVYP